MAFAPMVGCCDPVNTHYAETCRLPQLQGCDRGPQNCIMELCSTGMTSNTFWPLRAMAARLRRAKRFTPVNRRCSGDLSTWRRRIDRKLVTRTPNGYRLTDFGQELRPYAERIEAMIGDFERHVTDAGRDRSDVIRVTCPEPIVHRMTPLIARFHARHPELRVEFVMSDRYLDLVERRGRCCVPVGRYRR